MSEPTTTSTEHAAPHQAEQAVDRPQPTADLATTDAENDSAAPAALSASTSNLSPGAPVASEALRATDQALADDLDALLDGDFETIDAVLHGPSKSKARKVAKVEALRSETPASLHGDAATDMSLPDADMEDVATVTQTTSSSPVAPVTAIADDSPSATPSVQTVQSVASPDVTTPEARTVAESSPRQADPTAARPLESRVSSESDQNSQSHVQRLRQAVVNVLILVNFPLRLVPAGLKPAVDWIALSLLVWVPIVWMMAFVIGPGKMTAHAGSPSLEQQSLHSESTNSAKASEGGHEKSGSSSHESSGGAHSTKKSSSGSHDSGKPSAKSKAKAKEPPTKAAGNKLPTEKKGSSKSKSKDAAKASAEHH